MPVTEYTWDPVSDSILEETDGAGTVTASYTNEPSAYGPLISQHRDGQSRFFHFDALGSTRELTDEDENVTDSVAYDAWGNAWHHIGTTEMPFAYLGCHGYLGGPAVRTISTRLREYDSSVGAWRSIDKYRFLLTLESYVYAYNRPTLLIDPSGAVTVENCGPNKLACIELAIEAIKRAMEGRDCFQTGREDNRCRSVLQECLKAAIDGIKIECTKTLVGKQGNAPGACSDSRTDARENNCNRQSRCGETVPPDPGCGPCPPDLMKNSTVQLGSFDTALSGPRYNWPANPTDIGPTTCRGSDGNSGIILKLSLLIVHEMLHHCVGGHFRHDRDQNPPNDSCGRPGVPELVKDFTDNCVRRR